ncbi:hypothetical protein CQA57_07710 [Helicobacter anseris]|uniref:Copper resistance protein CopD n=1 Tax=Helicobacter anseris TaxID=375926 RepID=A0A3D8J3V1_9HELI|nr:hypothetical protein [Helicobacter anseris]RDU71534.1 hypothetical protein CQA57_07710 [Helicobacter anseris]
MQNYYSIFLVIHLFCAIAFVGYLFFDVVILNIAKRKINNFESFQNGISKVVTKIMPFIVLMLFISGGAMAGKYFTSPIDSTFQLLLLVKIILAFCIFALVVFSLSFYYIVKKPNPIGKFIHPIVFALCIIIVLLAKLMFLF